MVSFSYFNLARLDGFLYDFKNSTLSWCPFLMARSRGVFPLTSLELNSSINGAKNFMISILPFKAAGCMAVQLVTSSVTLTLLIKGTKSLTTSSAPFAAAI